jgi:hypothetical protein
MKHLHYIFYLPILLFCCNATFIGDKALKSVELETTIDSNRIYSDFLKNTAWNSDWILGLDRTKNNYKLTKPAKKKRKRAGNSTVFGENNEFTSFYSAFCGNDCFTNCYGHYQLIAGSRLEISVDSITYSGECKKSTERFIYQQKQYFQLKIQKDTIYLIKSK